MISIETIVLLYCIFIAIEIPLLYVNWKLKIKYKSLNREINMLLNKLEEFNPYLSYVTHFSSTITMVTAGIFLLQYINLADFSNLFLSGLIFGSLFSVLISCLYYDTRVLFICKKFVKLAKI
jgi:hypothetical protein